MNNPFEGAIKNDDFQQWFEQFEEEDRQIILKLLPYYKYYSSEKVFEMLSLLYEKLVNEHDIKEETTIFVPVGYTSKSGSAITYFFKRENKLDEKSFIAMNDLRKQDFHTAKAIVFLDDFIGSGEYIESIKSEFISKLSLQVQKRVKFICACMVGYEQGITKIENSNIMKVCVVERISSSLQPLHENSIIYKTDERKRAMEVLSKYNEPLKEKYPFGYGSIQGLVSFFFATPNNTFPIFWSSNNNWHPLFPRGDSRRNPNRLIVLPDFLVEHKVFSSEFNDRIAISEKITKSLYDCFLSLDRMNIMAEVFNNLGIGDDLIYHIIHFIESYQNLKHEQHPICTSFVIVDSKSEQIVGNELIADAIDLEIDNRLDFKNHLMMIDGWSNTVAINITGKVLGILKYAKNKSEMSGRYQNDKYLPIEYTSYIYHGLLIVFTDDDRVLVYYNGNRLMTKKGRDWHTQGNLRNISDIAISHNIVPAVLDRAIELAYKLSDVRDGAMICIGDEDNIKKYISPMGNFQFDIREKNILNADENLILSFVAQDGATIISANGEIINSMVRLESPRDVEVQVESDKGTRHNTAKKMSAVTNSIYITVSSDGPISIYVDGERILRVLG